MPEAEPTVQAVQEEIAREIVRVHDEAYGSAVSHVVVTVAEDAVLVVLDVELARNELTLVGAGRGDAVRHTREAFQEAIAPTFTAIVERATGRRVEGFASRMVMEPPWSAEVFRLAPRA
jgi:uncharacterized protein YbcI